MKEKTDSLKLTPELIESVCSQLKKGFTRQAVYNALGIPASTFNRWAKRKSFQEAMEHAEGEFYLALQSKVIPDISPEGKPSIELLKWFLERRFAEDFGARNKLQLDTVKPVKVILKKYAIPEGTKAKA